MRTLFRAGVAVAILLLLTGAAQALITLDHTPTTGSPRLDIGVEGNPAHDGSAYYHPISHAPFALGDGTGFTGTADRGFFLYEPVVGDGEMTVYVDSFTNGDVGSSMAGLMIRQSLDDDSVNVAHIVKPTDTTGWPYLYYGQGQYRDETGGATMPVPPDEGETPGQGRFVKITRVGDEFTFSWKVGQADPWETYSTTVNVPMLGTVYAGFVVSSADNNGLVTVGLGMDGVELDFSTPSTLTWDLAGSGVWHLPDHWIPSDTATTPDATTHVVLPDDPSSPADTVLIVQYMDGGTPVNDHAALSLTIVEGKLTVDSGQTLVVGEDVDVGSNGFLELGSGAALKVGLGGSIANLQASMGPATLDTMASTVTVSEQFVGALGSAATFTKLGTGMLQLDGLAGTVVAPKSTFDVVEGTLASKGVDPFGGADAVNLGDGTALVLENAAGAIAMDATVTTAGAATMNVSSAGGASIGHLTLGGPLSITAVGGLEFDGVSYAAPGVYPTDFVGASMVDVGALDVTAGAVTLEKTGTGTMILSEVGTGLENLTLDISDGAVLAIHGSNPMGPNPVLMTGGELTLASTSGVAEFDNALIVTADSTLTGGEMGLGLGGTGATLTGPVTISEGITLDLQSTDAYVLTVAGAIGGDPANTGGIEVVGGEVVLTGGAEIATAKVSDGDLTVNTAALTLDSLEVVGGSATTNVVINVGNLVASNDAELIMADTANVISAALSGNALVSATEMIVSNSLARGGTTYTIEAGNTFTVSDGDLLAAMDVSFGGAYLTVVGSSPVNQPNVNHEIVANGATIEANSTSMAVFGDLTMVAGVTDLALVTGAPGGISFSDVLVVEDDVEIDGDMTVRGAISVGSSPGVLDVIGDLTLAGTSIYVWELEDGVANDVINVSGNLEVKDGWTLKIETDRPFTVGGEREYVLFTFGDSFYFNTVQYDLSGTPDWHDGDYLKVRVRVDPESCEKQVILDVIPEPATWVLLLTGVALGLVACRRRRA